MIELYVLGVIFNFITLTIETNRERDTLMGYHFLLPMCFIAYLFGLFVIYTWVKDRVWEKQK